ncbi:MAG: sugar transferase [Bilifractor sp.]|nr:sugar transferase [Lachnospiraceae bacterium]MDY2836932.1 sugar transferase [Bilifractor sp.]
MDKDKAKKIIKGTAAALGATYVVLDVIAKKQKKSTVYADQPDQKNPMEGKKVEFVADENDLENADGECGHLEATGFSGAATRERSFYEKIVKHGLDKTLSFAGLVALAPVMGGIALAIKIEDPGPVLFTQKRVGQDKQYFKLHKFRSMKMSPPHDVPTHMLDHPEQYITRVGGFIRKHSLEARAIIRLTAGNLNSKGFCEYSPFQIFPKFSPPRGSILALAL